MKPVLVIGCGNELRGDDGVGPLIARAVAKWNLPNVEGISVTDWLPELAAKIAEASVVIFVDASVDASEVVLRPMQPASHRARLTHTGRPEELLEMVRVVFAQEPSAWLLSIPAARFEFGQQLSETARRAADIALDRLRDWIVEQQSS